jgi:hypothetical protein
MTRSKQLQQHKPNQGNKLKENHKTKKQTNKQRQRRNVSLCLFLYQENKLVDRQSREEGKKNVVGLLVCFPSHAFI